MLDAVDGRVDALVDDIRALVRIPSVGGTDAEHEAVGWLADRLRVEGADVDHWRLDLPALSGRPDFPGAEVERREAWGCVGAFGGAGAGRSVLLDGHVDVVPVGDPDAWSVDPFAAAERDGWLLGRGTADMKAGLLAALHAVLAVRAAGVDLAGDVLVAPVCGEEDGGLGTYALLDRGWRADGCVIPEPTDLDLVPANAGALTFRLRIRGRATHAARRLDGVSAIEKLLPVHAALGALERRRHETVDPLAARWDLAHPLSIGSVRAGDWASSVPDLLVAEGRYGVAIGEDVAAARAEFEAAVTDACAADEWLAEHPVEVEWWGGQFASGRTPDDSDLVPTLATAHEAAGRPPADVYGAPYGSDLRLLTAAGIPTVQYGPGDAAVAHGPTEAVRIDDAVHATRALALFLLDWCGVV